MSHRALISDTSCFCLAAEGGPAPPRRGWLVLPAGVGYPGILPTALEPRKVLRPFTMTWHPHMSLVAGAVGELNTSGCLWGSKGSLQGDIVARLGCNHDTLTRAQVGVRTNSFLPNPYDMSGMVLGVPPSIHIAPQTHQSFFRHITKHIVQTWRSAKRLAHTYSARSKHSQSWTRVSHFCR